MKNVSILGYSTSAGGLDNDIGEVWNILKTKSYGNYVACSNPHSLVEARTDNVFRQSLAEATILLPDGIGIVIAARILGLDLRERVAGSEFFAELSNQANQRGGLKYFFLGSTDTVLENIICRLQTEYPQIQVSGVYSPPFKDELDDDDNKAIINKINAAGPDVVWVGMTAPKQEKWIYKNKERLNVPLLCAVGAVFDFYAGTKKRAPEWACNLGIEWLPRLLKEPRRLFRRNFVSSPLFLFMVLQEKFNKLFAKA